MTVEGPLIDIEEQAYVLWRKNGDGRWVARMSEQTYDDLSADISRSFPPEWRGGTLSVERLQTRVGLIRIERDETLSDGKIVVENDER